MVGRLNLRNVCDEDLLEMNLKAERLLDSPDSGLPPSPSVSPSPWLSGDRSTTSSVCGDESRAGTPAVVSLNSIQFWVIYDSGKEKPLEKNQLQRELILDNLTSKPFPFYN